MVYDNLDKKRALLMGSYCFLASHTRINLSRREKSS